MSRETYAEYLLRSGSRVDIKRVVEFGRHRAGCLTCRENVYGYLTCSEGRRLAREAVSSHATA